METAPEIPSGCVNHRHIQMKKHKQTLAHGYLEDAAYDEDYDDGHQGRRTDHNGHQGQVFVGRVTQVCCQLKCLFETHAVKDSPFPPL